MKLIRLSLMLAFILWIMAGCSISTDDNITIEARPDSTYSNTFNELSLGPLFDFHFTLPNADQRWVRLWVESYKDGVKEEEPLSELSYGLSHNESEQGHLGFGIINTNEGNTLFFLYGPETRSAPERVPANAVTMDGMGSWRYANKEDPMELEIGETEILAVYRKAENAMRNFDFREKEQLEQLLEEDSANLLLKIRVEER
ncbi:hypothetical protein ACFFGV_15115 [Pontibacillus salicampi]|uniref:Lipoprotein n=1 Tax=Pontibacillus salicampi TaxID=1449801 RepID=A0ABV6LR64_9BACI